LRDFAFDIVKIDGQFTKNVAADADNQVMIQSLRSISDHFGMFTIAEAVECERDSQWLSETLVDCQLGYFGTRLTPRFFDCGSSNSGDHRKFGNASAGLGDALHA
jgi:EAL domain-containing protein (putative c-di-GMP-specific phosphodiesterase class I)